MTEVTELRRSTVVDWLTDQLAGQGCRCEDCRTDGPVAYLADLRAHALDHLAHMGPSETTVALLRGVFHEALAEEDGEDQDLRAREIRVCLAVLRGYLAACRPGMHFAAEVRDYLVRTYLDRLAGFGTSYPALRRSRTAADSDRIALAEELGLDWPDDLDRLLPSKGTTVESTVEAVALARPTQNRRPRTPVTRSRSVGHRPRAAGTNSGARWIA